MTDAESGESERDWQVPHRWLREAGRGRGPRNAGRLWQPEEARTRILARGLHGEHSPANAWTGAQGSCFGLPERESVCIV